VVTDNQAIGRLAARHFLDHGYREVFAAHPMGIPIFEQRLAAVTDHMQAAGGAVHMMEPVGSSWSHIIEQLESIATRRSQRLEELSIGIFAYEDYSAATLISVCLEHGLQVPQNVAVLGVDNDDLINAGLALGLSTIDTDLEGSVAPARDCSSECSTIQPATTVKNCNTIHPKESKPGRVPMPMPWAARWSQPALHWIAHHVIEGIQAIDVAKAMKISQQGLQKAFATHHVRTPGRRFAINACRSPSTN
jgi:hypothetical protein